MADDPGAVAFLRDRVRPVEPLPAKEFEKLLADLNAESSPTGRRRPRSRGGRERAVGQLATRCRGAECRAADAVGRLLTSWRAAGQTPPTGERRRVMRAVAALELAGTANAREVLMGLAGGAANETATRDSKQALERAGR